MISFHINNPMDGRKGEGKKREPTIEDNNGWWVLRRAVFTLRYFGQKLNIKCQSHRCNRNKQKAEARGGGLLAMDGNVLCSTQKNTMDFIIRIIMKLMRMIMKHCSAQQQQQLRSKFMQSIYKIMKNFDQPSRLSITAYVLVTASHHIRRISRWLKVSPCVVTMQQSQLSLPKLKLKWNKGWRAERMVKPMGGLSDGWMNEWMVHCKTTISGSLQESIQNSEIYAVFRSISIKNVHLLCPRDGVWVVGWWLLPLSEYWLWMMQQPTRKFWNATEQFTKGNRKTWMDIYCTVGDFDSKLYHCE